MAKSATQTKRSSAAARKNERKAVDSPRPNPWVSLKELGKQHAALRVLFWLLTAVAVIGLDLLISWNRLDLFLILLGLEILLTSALGWYVYFSRRRAEQQETERAI